MKQCPRSQKLGDSIGQRKPESSSKRAKNRIREIVSGEMIIKLNPDLFPCHADSHAYRHEHC